MTTLPSPTLHPRAPAPPTAEPESDRTIAIVAVLTGLALFAVLAVVGIIMRFGQASVLDVSPAWFYRLMTLHGAGMITAALLSMMGALWFVLRNDVRLSVPRMIASYVAIVVGVVFVLVATMIGGFAAGWTFLWPLPFDSAGQWSLWATVAFLLGVLFVGVGFCIFCIDVLEKTTRTYGGLGRALGLAYLAGRDPTPPPPQAIGATVVAVDGLIASAAGTTIVAALLVYSYDRGAQIDALWAKNLTYFFGHTIANLIIYLAAGIIYVLLPLYAGRPWKTSVPLVVGWLLTLVFVLTAYSHHLYMDTVQPRVLEYISNGVSDAAAIPVAVVTIFTGLMLVWGSGYRWTLASRLLYLGFAGWAIGGVGAVIDAIIPVNSRLHNTDWVPAHFHTYLLMGVMFWVFAFVAYLLEGSAARPAATQSSWLAPVLMVIGGYGLTGMWFAAGALGVPRRYAVQPPGTDGYSLAGGIFALIFLAGFLVLLAEFWALAAEAYTRPRPIPALDREAETGRLQRDWLAFRQRLAGLDRRRLSREPLAEPAAPGPPRLGPEPAIGSARGRMIALGAGVVVALITYPPLYGNADDDPHIHHLIHSGQFLAGALVGIAIGSRPSVFRRMRGGRGDALALGLVLGAPLVMLLVMAPRIYEPLEHHPVLHAMYHVGIGLLGVLTGIGCARLGRVAGWFLLFASVSMGLVWAAGLTGV